METLTTTQVVELSKCPEYTIHYWRTQGVISPIGVRKPGSGHSLEWDPKIVDILRVLVKIEKSFNLVSTILLKKVVDNFDAGELQLEEGIVLKW